MRVSHRLQRMERVEVGRYMFVASDCPGRRAPRTGWRARRTSSLGAYRTSSAPLRSLAKFPRRLRGSSPLSTLLRPSALRLPNALPWSNGRGSYACALGRNLPQFRHMPSSPHLVPLEPEDREDARPQADGEIDRMEHAEVKKSTQVGDEEHCGEHRERRRDHPPQRGVPGAQ